MNKSLLLATALSACAIEPVYTEDNQETYAEVGEPMQTSGNLGNPLVYQNIPQPPSTYISEYTRGQNELDLYENMKKSVKAPSYIIPPDHEYSTVDESEVEYKTITNTRNEIRECSKQCH